MRRLLPVVLLLLAALSAPALARGQSASPVDAEPGRGLVQPGMLLTKNGQAWCTGGFLLDGRKQLTGRVFLALAAHCYAHRIGTRVADEKGRPFGTLVYSHWPYDGFADDVALVEVDPAAWPRTTPEMAGRPGLPRVVGSAESVRVGDVVGFSGWGAASDRSSTTREQRPGVLNSYDGALWGAEGLLSPGDSGGPIVDVTTGAAVGSVSNVCVPLPFDTSEGFTPGCTGYGPTMEQLVRVVGRAGWPVSLRPAQAGRPR